MDLQHTAFPRLAISDLSPSAVPFCLPKFFLVHTPQSWHDTSDLPISVLLTFAHPDTILSQEKGIMFSTAARRLAPTAVNTQGRTFVFNIVFNMIHSIVERLFPKSPVGEGEDGRGWGVKHTLVRPFWQLA
jgi:hypothetical protein